MRAPLLFLPAIVVLAATLISCGAAEEVAQQPTPSASGVTAQATSPPGGAGGEIGPGTVVAPPSPKASPAPVPSDWATFTLDFGVSIRYPATWVHLAGGGVYSWDPDKWDKPTFPPDGIKLEPSALPVSDVPRDEGASDLSLGGNSGWQVVRAYDPSVANGIVRVHTVAVDHGGIRFTISGYFGAENVDETVFWQVVSSLTFSK